MDAHFEYAWLLIFLGRVDESHAKMQRALEIDPASVMAHGGLAGVYWAGRQYDQMLEQAKKALTLESNNPFLIVILGNAYRLNGLYEEAEEILSRIVPGQERWMANVRVQLLAQTGRLEEVRAIIHEAEQQWDRGNKTNGLLIPKGYIALGEYDRALEWLERVKFQENIVGILLIKVDPSFDPVRSDPRFQAVLETMGLAR